MKTSDHWYSRKGGNLGIDTIRDRFKNMKSKRQLRCWVRNLNKGVTDTEKLARIADYTLEDLKHPLKLLFPLFLVLKEPTRQFGPLIEARLFKPINVYVMVSKFEKLASGRQLLIC